MNTGNICPAKFARKSNQSNQGKNAVVQQSPRNKSQHRENVQYAENLHLQQNWSDTQGELGRREKHEQNSNGPIRREDKLIEEGKHSTRRK